MKKLFIFYFLFVYFSSAYGQTDNALHFDGIDDYVEVANTSNLDYFKGTIEYWIKPDELPIFDVDNNTGAEFCIMGMRGGAQPQDIDTRYSVHISSTSLGIWNGSSIIRFKYAFRSGEWYHLAFVWNSDPNNPNNHYINYYINGNYLGRTNYGFSSQTGFSLMLGAAKTTSGLQWHYKGAIDELRIFVAEYAEQDIRSRKDQAISGSTPTGNLLADYNFNTETVTNNNGVISVADTRGNCPAGILHNFALSGNTSNFVGSPFTQMQTTAGLSWKLNGNSGTDGGINAIGTTDNQRLAFKVNNVEKLTLLPNGNLGIGTSSPNHTFSVVGGNGFTVARISEKNYCFFEPNPDNDQADWNFGVWNGSWSGSLKMDAKAFLFGSRGSGAKVAIGTDDFSKIGTHSLAVNGSAIFNKVVVKLYSGSPGWPDYVFKKAYKLPSLKDVEDYIKANNHLPGVPSADEVKKNDLDIGENQALLLKKIEELTLYVIEQNKRLEAQNKKIAAQDEKVAKQQREIDRLSRKKSN